MRPLARNDIKILQTEYVDAGHADEAHNETGQYDTQGNRQGGGLDAHVQERRGQCAGPGTGAGQGNADKQHQSYEQTLTAGPGLQLLSAPFTFSMQ